MVQQWAGYLSTHWSFLTFSVVFTWGYDWKSVSLSRAFGGETVALACDHLQMKQEEKALLNSKRDFRNVTNGFSVLVWVSVFHVWVFLELFLEFTDFSLDG